MVHKYQPNCMHINATNARLFAENQRKQGSVFIIKELPAILVKGWQLFYNTNGTLEDLSSPFSYIVTQINTENPLAHYIVNPLISKNLKSGNRLKIDENFEKIAATFKVNSFYWSQRQSPNNSIIELSSCENNFEELNETTLKRYESISTGKTCALKWTSSESKISPIPVLKIIKEANNDLTKGLADSSTQQVLEKM